MQGMPTQDVWVWSWEEWLEILRIVPQPNRLQEVWPEEWGWWLNKVKILIFIYIMINFFFFDAFAYRLTTMTYTSSPFSPYTVFSIWIDYADGRENSNSNQIMRTKNNSVFFEVSSPQEFRMMRMTPPQTMSISLKTMMLFSSFFELSLEFETMTMMNIQTKISLLSFYIFNLIFFSFTLSFRLPSFSSLILSSTFPFPVAIIWAFLPLLPSTFSISVTLLFVFFRQSYLPGFLTLPSFLRWVCLTQWR